jgi:SAM-dependent methyltransferase
MNHLDLEDLERSVREEMEAYFREQGLTEEQQKALLFDQKRFARSIVWLYDLDLQHKKILDLGAPSLATRIVKRFFPNNSFTNTNFDLRTEFPYFDESFDVILNMEVIEHIFDLELLHRTTLSGVKHVLSECWRVLARGGYMFLTTPNACSIWIIQRALLQQPPMLYEYHFREFTFSEILDLLKATGFQIKRAVAEKVWHFWDFGPIEDFIRKNDYSLENRGDDTFVLAQKP